MRAKRMARSALGTLALLVLAVGPVAAQDSLNEKLISGLNTKLLYVAIPIAVLVELILLYTVLKFKDNDDPEPTQENRRLEITWTVATAIILLFVGYASFQVLMVPAIGGTTATLPAEVDDAEAAVTMDFPGAVAPPPGSNALEVEVVAQKYVWLFNYPNHNVTGVATTVVIPANRPVYFHVISRDWLHSFHVPDLGLKQDAFPGQYNTIKTVAYEPGTYQLYCAEYCGVGHSAMLGKVKVLPQDEFQQWLASQKQASQGQGQTGGQGQTPTATPSGNQTGDQNATGTPTQTQTEAQTQTQTATETQTAGGGSNETQTQGNLAPPPLGPEPAHVRLRRS